MAYANSSETGLAFVEEVDWGVTPATPAFQQLRMTGESLVYDIQNTESDEITPTADVTDVVQVGASASGDVQFELTFGAADTDVLLAHALRGSWATDELAAGIARKSMTLEKRFETGATDAFSRFRGMRVNTFGLVIEQQAITAATVAFIGSGESTGSAIITGATYAAPNAAKPMAAPDVANISVGGVSGSVFYSRLDFQLSNNCRIQSAVGARDAVGIAYGQRGIEGNLAAYFDTTTVALYDRFVSGAESSLSFDVSDPAGNTYTFLFPRVRFTAGRRVAGGNNQDVVAEMGWRALLDPVTGTAMKITRAAA